MSILVQDLIVSLAALGAVTIIGRRARAMFASNRSGAACGSCIKCPTTNATVPSRTLQAAPDPQSQIIRLTVIPASSVRSPR
jgi:hypothetical protein